MIIELYKWAVLMSILNFVRDSSNVVIIVLMYILWFNASYSLTVITQREIYYCWQLSISSSLLRSLSSSLQMCFFCSISFFLLVIVFTQYWESCLELIHQLSCFFQFQFTYSDWLPIHSEVLHTINSFYINNFADFSQIIRSRVFKITALIWDSDSTDGVDRFNDMKSLMIVAVTFSNIFSVTVIIAF